MRKVQSKKVPKGNSIEPQLGKGGGTSSQDKKWTFSNTEKNSTEKNLKWGGRRRKHQQSKKNTGGPTSRENLGGKKERRRLLNEAASSTGRKVNQ